MGCCVTPLLLYGSYQYIATGAATVFHFVYPAVVVLIGLVFLRKKLNTGTVLAMVLCVGGICMFYNPNEPLDWGGCGLAPVIGVGAVVMFQRGTFLIGGERASILSTVEPLTGVVMGMLVFNEKVTAVMGIGAVLVICACILITVSDSKKQSQDTDPT